MRTTRPVAKPPTMVGWPRWVRSPSVEPPTTRDTVSTVTPRSIAPSARVSTPPEHGSAAVGLEGGAGTVVQNHDAGRNVASHLERSGCRTSKRPPSSKWPKRIDWSNPAAVSSTEEAFHGLSASKPETSKYPPNQEGPGYKLNMPGIRR